MKNYTCNFLDDILKNMVNKLLLLFCIISATQFYAMDEQSCCSLIVDQIITKIFGNEFLVTRYKKALEDEFSEHSYSAKNYPSLQHSESLGLAAWKIKRFDQLCACCFCVQAKEVLSEEFINKKYLQDQYYQDWAWDKSLRGEYSRRPLKDLF